MGAITSGFTDEAVVELNVARLLFDLTESSKIVEANLAPIFSGDWTEGSGIRSQMTQESSNIVSVAWIPRGSRRTFFSRSLPVLVLLPQAG